MRLKEDIPIVHLYFLIDQEALGCLAEKLDKFEGFYKKIDFSLKLS